MTTAITPMEEVCKSIQSMEPKFKECLPAHVSAERFTRVAMNAIQNTPSLLELDRRSLYQELLKCASDGLLCDGREATIMSFKGLAKYNPMVGGILKKVRNSGELASIASNVIYKNDKFRYWTDGDGEHLEHEPLLFGDRGDKIGVYALAKTKDKAVYVEVMTTQQVNSVKAISKDKKFTPWNGPFEDEMWRKTAIRRLSKRLPMSTDLEQVIHRDDELYDLPDKEPVEPVTVPKNLEKVIDVKAEPKKLVVELAPEDMGETPEPAEQELPI